MSSPGRKKLEHEPHRVVLAMKKDDVAIIEHLADLAGVPRNSLILGAIGKWLSREKKQIAREKALGEWLDQIKSWGDTPPTPETREKAEEVIALGKKLEAELDRMAEAKWCEAEAKKLGL